MKKWIVLLGLIILVVWGVFDLSDNQASKEIQHEQNESNEQQIDDQLDEQAEIVGEDIPTGLNWGEKAPDFTLLSLEGEETSLSDWSGKKVMINFWASWCPPCIEEMPDMQAYYEERESDDFVVLAVNLAESEKSMKDVTDFIDEFELTFPVVVDDDSSAATLYQVRNIPTTYILNSGGIIEEKIIGPMTYEIMEELMDPIE